MRWSITVGSWARREAVLGSALAAGVVIAALAGPLDVAWLKLAGAIVVALGAIARVVIAVRRARLEGEVERAQLGRLLRVDVVSVGDAHPTLIGIDRAEQAILPGEGVPDYVRRAADGDLRAGVAAALDGSGQWIVVVEGPSKVGKSRSLFEALRECGRMTPLEIVAPVNGDALRSLLTPGQGPRAASGAAVLWLDDLEPFLNDGVTLHTLREWHAAAPGRMVAATYGGKGNELIAGSPVCGLGTTASEVLRHARRIPLQATTPAELAGILADLPDALVASLQRHGLAAYLVAGPALETKLNTHVHAPGDAACPDGVALVYGAVDWARSGRTDPIAKQVLRDLWPSYLAEGARVTDDCFARALTWALEPVAGSIALLQQRTGSYQAFDYVVRLERDKRGGRPPHKAAWAAAINTATDGQALAVGTAAYQHARRDHAIEALARARTSSIEVISSFAAISLGVVQIECARDSNDGVLLNTRHQEAIAIYDEVVVRNRNATDSTLCQLVATALFHKGISLGGLKLSEAAIEVYDDVVNTFGDADDLGLRENVAKALFNKGDELRALEVDRAIAVYDDIATRFGDAADPVLRELVAKALLAKVALGRSEDAISIYDVVLERDETSIDPTLRKMAAQALLNKGIQLAQLKRHDEAISVLDEAISVLDALIKRFGTDSALRELVAGALLTKGVLHGEEHPDHAMAAWSELIGRERDATDSALRQPVASALLNTALMLGDDEDAVVLYDEIVERDGTTRDLPLRKIVANALENKAGVVSRMDGPTKAIAVYDDLVKRFGDASDPVLRANVDFALVTKGGALEALKEVDRAIGAYDDVLKRDENTKEPALLDMVEFARQALSRLGD